jgi:hypothetical protein
VLEAHTLVGPNLLGNLGDQQSLNQRWLAAWEMNGRWMG